jgi:L-lactate dehydrogenase (cytochrome)
VRSSLISPVKILIIAFVSSRTIDASLAWADLPWLKKAAGGLPILIKGIQTYEDALLAYQCGASGIIIGNHGGRQVNSYVKTTFSYPSSFHADLVSPISYDSLPFSDSPSASTPLETLLEIRRNAPHLISNSSFSIVLDGGIRRGSAIVKALCLGTTAVSLGRPFMYSLIFGEDGVEKVARILEDEVERCMRLLGVRSVKELRPEMVNTRRVERRMWGEGSKL